MITAREFIGAAAGRGFSLYTGVPCSYLTPFINQVLSDRALRYVGAVNEGDAVAIAAGAVLGGRGAIAMFQNSGLGNAVNPLTSLTWTFRLPVLLIVTWRGQPGGAADEPQHELMGEITPRLLELMDIPWRPFPAATGEIAAALDAATRHFESESRPFAFVMSKGAVAETKLDAAPPLHLPRASAAGAAVAPVAARQQMLAAIQAALQPRDLVIATTGFCGRELYALDDRPNQLYMVGSMGCAVSFGLGLALAQPRRRIIVIDGDGALLMRLGVLATLGAERPPNLLHLLLDNGMHESTGGQATVARNVDFCAAAAASGYPETALVNDPAALGRLVASSAAGLRFIHAPIRAGIPEKLPRPKQSPVEVAARFRAQLQGCGDA
ncbi:MAG: phosphonopyruvate decarboxylase [Gammaproteobacteria bacterium]|nr:MAG: phosphonopyruvate decarboxylase [Gammaproteobacteria bacterium]